MKTLISTLDFTLDYIEPKRLCSLKAYVDASIKTAIECWNCAHFPNEKRNEDLLRAWVRFYN